MFKQHVAIDIALKGYVYLPSSSKQAAAAVFAHRQAATGQGVGTALAFSLGVVLLSLVLGLVAVTANPIFVALATAALVGPMLIAKPTWIIWLVLVLGVVVAGLVPIWADGMAGRAVWGISALCFLLMLGALFRVVTKPGLADGTPAFVWLALAFMVYALVISLMRWSSVYEVAAGFKRYFQAFGLIFALCWLTVTSQDVQRWRLFFLIAALLQLPFAVYELLHIVPLREGFRFAYPGMVPVDAVAGTFGTFLYQGGANAEMATFLIIVLVFLMARFHQRLLSAKLMLTLALLVLAPLFLGETKVVVLFLPLAFIVLYRQQLLGNPLYALGGLVGGLILAVAALLSYVAVTKSGNVDNLVYDTLRYNIGNQGHGNWKLNRTTAIKFWAERQSLDDPASAIVGNGLGSSHDNTGGSTALRYPGFGIGLTAASTLLWDLGLLGLGLFLSILVAAWRSASKLRLHCKDPAVQADTLAIQAALMLFGFYLIYRISLLELLSFQIVFAATLGYLAWLMRRHLPGKSSVV